MDCKVRGKKSGKMLTYGEIFHIIKSKYMGKSEEGAGGMKLNREKAPRLRVLFEQFIPKNTQELIPRI